VGSSVYALQADRADLRIGSATDAQLDQESVSKRVHVGQQVEAQDEGDMELLNGTLCS
jgi:hypothetical protein